MDREPWTVGDVLAVVATLALSAVATVGCFLVLVAIAGCGSSGYDVPAAVVDAGSEASDAGQAEAAAQAEAEASNVVEAGPLDYDYDADAACPPFQKPDSPRSCELAPADAGIGCDRQLLVCEPEAYPTSLSCVRFRCSAFWCCDPS